MLMTNETARTIMAHHEHEAQAKLKLRAECDEALRKGVMTSEQVEEVMMAKGVPTSVADMAGLTTIDVAPSATNVQWDMVDARELVLNKILPTEDATLVAHQWTRLLTYMPGGFSGFVPESGRGVTVKPTSRRDTIYLKMMSVEADTTLMAGYQTAVIETLGTRDQVEVNRRAAQLALHYKANQATYRSRTDTNRDGINGIDFKGLEQQIQEGTDGTVGAASQFSTAFGGTGHVIDMKGRPLTFDNIRAAGIAPIVLRLGVTGLLMEPAVMSGLSASLDGAIRMSDGVRAMRWGKTNDGVAVGLTGPGNEMLFIPDNTLSPIYYQAKYETDRPTGAPTSVPVVLNFSVTSDNAAFQGVTDTVTSRWDSNPEGVGSVYWVLTYEQDGIESLGTRYPTGTSTQAVTASQQVNFQVQTPPGAQRIRVYRSQTDQSATAATEAWHIFDVATDASGVTVFFDNNLHRPNTSRAFGLALDGGMFDSMRAAGSAEVALEALKRSGGANLGTSKGAGNNGVYNVHLGPKMGQLEMGRLALSMGYPVANYSIRTPLVKDPPKNFVFKNVRAATDPSEAPYA